MDDASYWKILKDGNIRLSMNAGMAGLKMIFDNAGLGESLQSLAA